jgi:uncharacterized protein (DUF697 family)
VLRAASGARVPIVGITAGESLPYVLDTDLVLLPPGRGFPVDEVARALAGRLGERGVGLAARLPVLRDAVVDQLIRSTSRRNALLAAAVFVPRAEMPVLAARQVAMVLRIARAYRLEPGPDRLPEAVGVVGAGFGFRAAARALLDVAPGPAWAVRGTVAYAGTRSVGEAARLYFASRTTDAAMPSEAGPTLGA